MKYRIDRCSGNRLSVLGFGCMRLPRNIGGIDIKKSNQLIMQAIKDGINYFDTAYLYPGSENALGKILSDNNVREQVYIATKLPISNCRKAVDFDRFFFEQLKSLRTDYIDYYLMHYIGSFAQWDALCQLGIMDWIRHKKESRAIRQIGFSFHGTCADFLKILDAYDWDFCQIQYNYSDEHYQAGVTGLKKAAEKNIPVVIMEPLLGGKLANGLPKRAEDVFYKANPDITPAAWGLRWLLNQPEVTVILSGMNRDTQVTDNLKTAEDSFAEMLTDTEHEAYQNVIRIFRESYKIPCTGCSYCLPCPKQVNIPNCFSAYNTSHSMGLVTGLIQYVIGTGANRMENHMAHNCVECGKCEKHCPQNIPIRNELKQVRKRLEPFYLRVGLWITRKFL